MRNWTKPTRTCLPADLLICHEFRARLEDVRMITVDGDSTEPLLPSGCHILINVSTQRPVPTERRRTQILRSAVRATMTSLYGPLARLYWCRLPGLVRGNEHSAIIRAMKPRLASASLAETSWCTWSGLGEAVQRLRRGVAEFFHRSVQIGQGITDRNQTVSFTRHGFILPCLSGFKAFSSLVSRQY